VVLFTSYWGQQTEILSGGLNNYICRSEGADGYNDVV
jgi:hypothetical protein